MDTQERSIVAKNITMYPDDWSDVQAVSARLSVSRSAALRVILQEWRKLTGKEVQNGQAAA